MTIAEHQILVEEAYICPLCELSDCFTSESEDEPLVNDNSIDTSSSNISTSDPRTSWDG